MKQSWLCLVWMIVRTALITSAGAAAGAEEVCRVVDPTNTPLNVRTAPDGKIVGTLSKGAQVTALDHSWYHGKDWVFVGRAEDRTPIGWVFRAYLDCHLGDTTVESLQPGPGEQVACFVRSYDGAHLAEHPDQLVTSMTLALDPSGPVARAARTGEGRNKVPFDFKIAATKRGDGNLYVQTGFVEKSDGEYRGVVDCDGGGFTLRKTPTGALLSIGLGDGYKQSIRMATIPDPCGDGGNGENSMEFERGRDDRTVLLNIAPDRVCRQLFDNIDWAPIGLQNR